MSNILIESEEYLLSTTQGISEFLQYVAQKNNSRIRLRRFNKVSHKDLQWCDVIVSVRGKSALSYGIAQYAKKNGKYHILYMDDDFLSISDTYGRYGMGIYPKRKQFVNKILQITDCIWVANDSLGNKYVKLSRCKYYVKTDTVVTENDLQPYSAKEANALKLVMYVNDGSTYDFEKIVSPALEEIAQKYKGKLELSLLTLKMLQRVIRYVRVTRLN